MGEKHDIHLNDKTMKYKSMTQMKDLNTPEARKIIDSMMLL